jgi:hypothetical protein
MGGGSATITGSTGVDKVIGGSGAITFHAGTGKSTFIGGNANNSVFGSTNVTILESGYTSYSLTNTLLSYGAYSDTLNGVFTINLTAPTSGATTFTVSNFSHTVTLDGNGNTSSSASVTLDGDLTLNGGVLQESNGGLITLTSIPVLSLHGGVSANTFTVNSWSGGGTVTLDAAGGSDLYKVNLQGSGSQLINVNDSGATGVDSLVVTGTNNADTLNVSGGVISRASETVNYTGIEFDTVNTLGGNDTVNINKPNAALLVNGGNGVDVYNISAIDFDTTIDLGTGTNVVNVGTLAPVVTGGTLNNIKAVLSVQGGSSGTSTLNLDDSGDGSASAAVLNATSLTGVFGAGGSLQYSSISIFNLTLGSGGNTVTVVGNGSGVTNLSTGSGSDVLNLQGITGVLNINLGTGLNTVNIGSNAPGTGGTLARLNGIISLTGSGNDIMNVDDSGSTKADTGTLRPTSLTFLDPVTINFTGFANLNISLSQAGDLFAIVDTFTSASTTPVIVIDGNGGDDIFSVLDTHAVTTINGDDGNDSMYIFANSSVLNLFGNNGDDSFYVFASVLPGSQSAANVNGGAADSNGNQYYSYRVNAPVNIDGGAGNDKVFIFGTVLNDVITIDGTHVTGAGIDVTFTNCETLVVAGMGGDDIFYIKHITIDTTVMGDGALPVFPPGVTPPDLTGGAPPATSFNDTFYVGWQGAFIPGSLSIINATLTIQGNEGIDTAYIDNSADTVNRLFTLIATTLDSNAMGPNGHIVYDNTVDNLNLQSGAGNDTITVNGTGAGLQTTIWGGAGNDAFIVNAPLTTPLAINGESNTFNGDTLTINGSGFGNNFVITGFTVDGAGATINYATVELLTVNGISGNNTFTLNGDSIPTYLDGGTDDDLFTVNANSVPAFLNGNNGNDTFIVNGNSGPLNLAGNDGNDTFTINGSSSGTLTAIGGNGNDTFVVNSLSSPGSLDGGAGDDSFTVNAPLSAILTITGGTGVADSLTVNGTSGNDFWVINAATVAGVGAPISYSNLQFLTVNGLAGNDTFNVQSTSIATTVNTGTGFNVVNIGSHTPDANGILDNVLGAVTVVGNGSDTLNVDDTGSVSGQSGTLSSTQLTGLSMAGINYTGVAVLNISLGYGADTILILDTARFTVTNIYSNDGDDVFNVHGTTGTANLYGGAGNDTFNFGSSAPALGGTFAAIAGQVNVNGGGGSDTVNVDDSGNTAAQGGTLTSTAVTLGVAPGITYSQVENLNILLGAGNDFFDVQSTNGGTSTVLSTGGGANTIDIASTEFGASVVDGIQGPLVLIGSGSDTLNINDSGSTVGKTGQLTPTNVTGLGMGQSGITFSGISEMVILLGSGNDHFTVDEMNNAITTIINGGAGQDVATLIFEGDFDAGSLTLLNFEHGTLSVGGNFNGVLEDMGMLETVTIGGSLTASGILSVGPVGSLSIGGDLAGKVDAGAVNTMTIGGNLEGLLNVAGLLNSLAVTGGTPGEIIAGNINVITVQAGFGNRVLQVIEGGVERQIQALPLAGGDMPGDTTFNFTYDSTGASPALTIHITNPSVTRFDLVLAVHSASAKFNLARVDAQGASGIGNISVEGDIVAGAGGVVLPTDTIIGVEVRDALPVGMIQVAGLEGFAFGTLLNSKGKPMKLANEVTAKVIHLVTGSVTPLLPATDTFRIPFSENHTVNLYAESDGDRDLDFVATFTDQIADNTGITALVQLESGGGEKSEVIQNLQFLGDGGAIRTPAAIANITSTGALGDLYIGGKAGLGNVTASSIIGSITVTNGAITGVIQTTGIRIDPITGDQSDVNADIGKVLVGKKNKTSVTTIYAKLGLTGKIITRGSIISLIKIARMGPNAVIAAQGDIGYFLRDSNGNLVSKAGKLVRFGGLTLTSGTSGNIIALGNIIGDVRIRGVFAGRIASEGQAVDGLDAARVGILGNLVISKLAASGVVASGGLIGDAQNKTTISAGKAAGIIAADGSVNATRSTKAANLMQNVGAPDNASGQAISGVFADGGEPLLFDVSTGDLQGLALIQQDLGNLSVGNDGNLTGSIP